jgi:hypothetical protein
MKFYRLLLLFVFVYCLAAQSEATDTSDVGFQKIKQGLAFIYDGALEPCSDVPNLRGEPSGTGFFIALRTLDDSGKPNGVHMNFLITNEHVINSSTLPNGSVAMVPKSSIIIRLNNKTGSSFTCAKILLNRDGPEKNVFSVSPEVDLVAIFLGSLPIFDSTLFDYTLIAGNAKYGALEVGEGTPAYTVGYLLDQPGLHKNSPVFRFGRIALVSDERWLLSGRGILEQANLIEVNTTFGASGSPVFIDPLQTRASNGQWQFRKNGPIILGVIKGAMHTRIPLEAMGIPLRFTQAKAPIGLATMEPGENLRLLMREVANEMSKPNLKFYVDDTIDQTNN